MKVGIPREVKNHEYRVAITPAGVHQLVRGGHQVLIEAGAGVGSSIPDEELRHGLREDPSDRGRRVGRRGHDPQGQGADRTGVPPHAFRPRCCSLTCTWPRPGPAPTRCSAPASPRSRTRPSSCPTGRCRCSPRCPRWWLDRTAGRRHGVLVERGDEDDQRPAIAVKAIEHTETVEIGQPHVEEDKIGTIVLQYRDGVLAEGALRHHIDVVLRGQQFADPLPGQRLVVDDDGPHRLHAAASAGWRAAR